MGQNTIWELGIQIVKHGGTFLQLEKANPKMGFTKRPNMALAKMGFKDQIGLIWGKKNMENKGRRGRRREEEEEGGFKPRSSKVWKLTLIMHSMRFGMDHMNFVWNSRKDY